MCDCLEWTEHGRIPKLEWLICLAWPFRVISII
jgi:hypothetical protein